MSKKPDQYYDFKFEHNITVDIPKFPKVEDPVSELKCWWKILRFYITSFILVLLPGVCFYILLYVILIMLEKMF